MKTYPHEQLLNKEKMTASDLPEELKERIEFFEEKFDNIDPDSLPMTHPIIATSQEIAGDIQDWLNDQDTGDEMSQEEINEQVLLDALGNVPRMTCAMISLQNAGFKAVLPVGKEVQFGSIFVKRESKITKNVVIRSK